MHVSHHCPEQMITLHSKILASGRTGRCIKHTAVSREKRVSAVKPGYAATVEDIVKG